MPVHNHLLTRGVPLFESLTLTALSDHLASQPAGRKRYAFGFVFSPIRVKGGTGSAAAPLAVL